MNHYISALPLELGAVGVGSYTRDLLAGLGRSHYADNITLLVPPWLEEHATVTNCGLCREIIAVDKRWPKTARSVLWCEKVAALLRGKKGALFHSPGLFASALPIERSFITCHDVIPLRYPVYLGKWFYRRWLFFRNLRTLRGCMGVFTDSLASRDDLVRLAKVNPKRIHVLKCWLANEFRSEQSRDKRDRVREKYQLPDRFWLYVGGYDIRKNIPFLLDAYSRAKKVSNQCPPLVLAGKIPTRKNPAVCDVTSAIAQHHLGRYEVIQPGFVADEDLPGLYAAAELLVFPSLYEGFGLPPLEAMGCGCPAVVADNSSLREVVTDESYRFPTGDPSALTNLLVHAAENPLPLNPSFRREEYELESRLEFYFQTLGLQPS